MALTQEETLKVHLIAASPEKELETVKPTLPEERRDVLLKPAILFRYYRDGRSKTIWMIR